MGAHDLPTHVVVGAANCKASISCRLPVDGVISAGIFWDEVGLDDVGKIMG